MRDLFFSDDAESFLLEDGLVNDLALMCEKA